MPYTGASDPSLPSKVKKLSAKKRRQWIGVFNSAYKRCLAGKTRIKPASKKSCESFAFQNAYGVVKKDDDMSNARLKRKQKALEVADNPTEDKELEEITDEEAQVLLESYSKVEEEELPLDGAQTWEQRDEFVKAEVAINEEKQVVSEFREMIDNILVDDSLNIDEKGNKIAVLAESFPGQTEEVKEPEPEQTTNIIDKVLSAIGIKRGSKKAPETKVKYSGFVVQKDLKGNHRWFGWVSNKFRDRDKKAHPKGEIIAEAAHKEFIDWVYEKAEERMPQLWLWHTPQTAMKARADWLDYADGFLLESGVLTEEEAKVCEQLNEKHSLAMSHGFFKLGYDSQQGIITKYRQFEGSVLPRQFAANEWTDFQEAKDMGFTPERRQFLVDALGEEKVAKHEASTKNWAEVLNELGIENKEVEEEQVVVEEKTTLEEPVIVETSEAEVKEILESLGIDKLSEYLEGQDTLIREIKTAVETQAKTIAELQKSDDEKVAEVLKPRVDVKEDIQPVWLRQLSKSDETILTEEEEKSLEVAKETGASWISAAMGVTTDPGANVPM